MDHLSADLLCEDLPRDREGTRVVNIYTGLCNNRETNHSTDTHGCVYVSPWCGMFLDNCQINLLQVINHTIYCFRLFIKLSYK